MTQNPKLLFVTTEALAPTIPKAVEHPPNLNADAQLLTLNYYLLTLNSSLFLSAGGLAHPLLALVDGLPLGHAGLALAAGLALGSAAHSGLHAAAAGLGL